MDLVAVLHIILNQRNRFRILVAGYVQTIDRHIILHIFQDQRSPGTNRIQLFRRQIHRDMQLLK